MLPIQIQNTPTPESLKIEGKNAVVLLLIWIIIPEVNSLEDFWLVFLLFVYIDPNKDFSSVWRISDVVLYWAEDILGR